MKIDIACFNYVIFLPVIILISMQVSAQSIGNERYRLAWDSRQAGSFIYQPSGRGSSLMIGFPSFRLNGRKVNIRLDKLHLAGSPLVLRNKVTQYTCEGTMAGDAAFKVAIDFQVSPDNPVLRFRYRLQTNDSVKMTKTCSADNITYLRIFTGMEKVKEIGLSKFDERFHATHLTEQVIDPRYFEDSLSCMGPLIVGSVQQLCFLAGYEHGSQYGDRFLQFRFDKKGFTRLEAVKGNYCDGQAANGYSTLWFDVESIRERTNTRDGEDRLAANFRDFVLKYLSQNAESRKPYIFYNTWGRQERTEWRGGKYLSSMTLDQTLKEIDRANAMGIEVYVIDAGWFNRTGDWAVNTDLFPDTLRQVKARLASYGMKLGLWFNPTVAAVTSRMYEQNTGNRMSWNGVFMKPQPVWETPESVGLCLVSPYWENFADKLIDLSKRLGVTYFKWDGIGQYGCNDPHHYHGTENNTEDERAGSYAFLLPLYMSRIIDRLTTQCPEAIVDFDITEPGRCVGLQFLSSGKYFIINNGPYFHNFDLADEWKSPLPDGNANIFVNPGPARGWFVRSVLDYDKWIPSNLFLTHYQPDGPADSRLINLASLILGQNGIWGEILRTTDSAVRDFHDILLKYKSVREDIELATAIRTGTPGESPEIYEKINPANGRGCIVLFANRGGDYTYVSKHAVAVKQWHTEGVDLQTDRKGRVIIHMHPKRATAAIMLFGTE